MPGGVIQFLFLYHPLHDTYGIHTENCVIIIVVVYMLIVWTADRTPRLASRKQKGGFECLDVCPVVLFPPPFCFLRASYFRSMRQAKTDSFYYFKLGQFDHY